ncbi:site-specific integrase [Mycobacterium malmoense]|uniref:site-specific integrase n=1 Tax=Mycobacterium malmoense TaxID=1780 RepID=UPI0021005811|nr:site-specific integrase [Mycobacterium malmoense]
MEVPTADGKRRKKYVSAKDYKTAKRKLDELKDDMRRGVVVVNSTATVGGWLRYWADHIKKPHVRPNTFDWYDEAIRLHITPHIGSIRLKQLTAMDVRFMLDQIGTSANKQRAHKTLRMALGDAMAEGYVARNIAETVPKPGHVKRVRGSLPADDAKRAIKAAIDVQASCDETTPLLATRWAAALLTGARPAELLGLEWDRVDLDAGVINLEWQLQEVDREHGCGPAANGVYPCGKKRASFCPERRWPFNDGEVYRECVGRFVWTLPKTSAGTRIVPIMPSLLEMLRLHQSQTAAAPNPHGLVWHRRDGAPIARSDDTKSWRAVLAAADLPQLEVYATRHSAATLLQELGVPDEVRMQIMGQSSAAAHAAYIHINQTQIRAGLGKLEQLLLA